LVFRAKTEDQKRREKRAKKGSRVRLMREKRVNPKGGGRKRETAQEKGGVCCPQVKKPRPWECRKVGRKKGISQEKSLAHPHKWKSKKGVWKNANQPER